MTIVLAIIVFLIACEKAIVESGPDDGQGGDQSISGAQSWHGGAGGTDGAQGAPGSWPQNTGDPELDHREWVVDPEIRGRVERP